VHKTSLHKGMHDHACTFYTDINMCTHTLYGKIHVCQYACLPCNEHVLPMQSFACIYLSHAYRASAHFCVRAYRACAQFFCVRAYRASATCVCAVFVLPQYLCCHLRVCLPCLCHLCLCGVHEGCYFKRSIHFLKCRGWRKEEMHKVQSVEKTRKVQFV